MVSHAYICQTILMILSKERDGSYTDKSLRKQPFFVSLFHPICVVSALNHISVAKQGCSSTAQPTPKVTNLPRCIFMSQLSFTLMVCVLDTLFCTWWVTAVDSGERKTLQTFPSWTEQEWGRSCNAFAWLMNLFTTQKEAIICTWIFC